MRINLNNPIHKLRSYLIVNSANNYEISPLHHFIFWGIYFLFNTFRWGIYHNDYLLSLKGNLLGFPIHMILCYLTIYILIPKFIFRRKFLFFGLSLLVLIFFMVWIKYILTYELISQNVWPEGPETTEFTFNWAIVMMLGELYVISFVTAIKITIDWLRENRRSTQLKKAQLESELKFLRTQISPHFLFNTLNNIYSLSLEKSDKVPDTIIKLSEFMKYLLYGTQKEQHSLEKEIDCIKNYIALEKIRHGDNLKLKIDIEGEFKGKKIRPMILIPFIENAFKHGANQTLDTADIKIYLHIVENSLMFKIYNSKPSESLKIQDFGGIGISNVKKRLNLSYHKNDYFLNIQEKPNEYIVELNLKLS